MDTAGWMTMVDSKDPLHVQSLEVRDKWLENGGLLVTSDYVLDETLTLIRVRLGLKAAKEWYKIITGSPRCIIEWITPERVQKAIRWFFDWEDQTFSFTDCTSFVVMRDLNIGKVLTCDQHFLVAGFEVLP